MALASANVHDCCFYLRTVLPGAIGAVALANTPTQHNLEVVDVWGVEPQSVRRSIAGLTTSNSVHARQLQSTDRKCRAG